MSSYHTKFFTQKLLLRCISPHEWTGRCLTYFLFHLTDIFFSLQFWYAGLLCKQPFMIPTLLWTMYTHRNPQKMGQHILYSKQITTACGKYLSNISVFFNCFNIIKQFLEEYHFCHLNLFQTAVAFHSSIHFAEAVTVLPLCMTVISSLPHAKLNYTTSPMS